MIRKPSTWYFLLEALGAKTPSGERVLRLRRVWGLPLEWLRYKMGRPRADFIEQAVSRLGGIERSVLEGLAEKCFQDRMRAGIYTGAAALVREIQERGERVMFASATLRSLIAPLERYLGVEESLASVLQYEGGRTTGRLEGPSFFGQGKKDAVERRLVAEGIAPEAVWFYSDSYTDLPLLRFCGHPVAVNPDRFLAREASRHGWPVLRFRETLGR